MKTLQLNRILVLGVAILFTCKLCCAEGDQTLRFEPAKPKQQLDEDHDISGVSQELPMNNEYSADKNIYMETDPDKMTPEEKCTSNNESFWGEMSTCNTGKTGVYISISWCPKLIQNMTVNDKIYLKVNNYSLSSEQNLSDFDAQLRVSIPGFNRPIYDQTIPENCSQLLHKHIQELKTLVKCPFNFNQVKKWLFLFKNPYGVSNPLPTIVPAGSYHLEANITNHGKPFLCIDGWLEFGL